MPKFLPSTSLKKISLEQFSALFTWAIVSSSGLYFIAGRDDYSFGRVALTALLYVVFIILWLGITRDKSYANEPRTRATLIALQFCTIISLYFLVPFTYTAILMVMLCSALPYIVNFKTALLLSPLFALPLTLVYGQYWGYTNTLLTAVLFWTFNLFALVMINSMLKERAASEALSISNRDLLATQSLLQQAAQQSERIRIARNIHDLLGHHLTALTIKLQVAERISAGDAKSQISECHGLAKLLLSDVREAVTEIRDKSSIDISSAIDSIISATPRLNITFRADSQLSIQNVNLAEVILRTIQESITNTLKHGNASDMSIALAQGDETVQLTITDNNDECSSSFNIGNGLTGILERARSLGGNAEFSVSPEGFKTDLHVSLAQ